MIEIVIALIIFGSMDFVAFLVYMNNKRQQDRRWQRYIDGRSDRDMKELFRGDN